MAVTTASQCSTRYETPESPLLIMLSFSLPILLNMVDIASSILLICPVMVFDCSSISPPNLPPLSVIASIAFCTSGKPTFPAVTSSPTLSLVTPNCLASSSANGIPRPINWRKSWVKSRPCVMVVPYSQTRSFNGMESPEAISPSLIKVSLTSSAAVP